MILVHALAIGHTNKGIIDTLNLQNQMLLLNRFKQMESEVEKFFPDSHKMMYHKC